MASPHPPVQIRTDLRSWSVHVEGEIDIATAGQLAEALHTVVAAGGRMVLLHLDRVTFLDSSGIRVIAATANELRDSGGQLLVEAASGAVARTLEVAGQLDRLARTAA